MHPLWRAVWGTAGLVLLGAGVLYAVLGFWGMSRRGDGAGWLAALGTATALGGALLVAKAYRGGAS